MQTLIGILSINSGESSVKGTLVAVAGGTPDELTAATYYLLTNGYDSGQCVKLSGQSGTAGVNVPVFYVAGAEPCA
jgi:hypothetical protein